MTEELGELQSGIFKAMAHPTRLSILRVLRRGERCVCELAAELELEQPNVSQHLSLMRRQGIIQARKRGLWVYHSIANPRVLALLDESEQLVREQNRAVAMLLDQPGASNGA